MDPNGKIAGIEALRRGDSAAAVAELTRVTAEFPVDPEAWGYLGVAHGQAGQPHEAVRCLKEAARLAPRSAPLWHNLGGALEQAGRGPEAQDAYRYALAADPAYHRSREALSRLERVLALVASGATADPERTIVPVGDEGARATDLPDLVDEVRETVPAADTEPRENTGADPGATAGAAPPVTATVTAPPPAGTAGTAAPLRSAGPSVSPPGGRGRPESPARKPATPRSRGTAALLVLLGVTVAVALGWLLIQAGEWFAPRPRLLPPGVRLVPFSPGEGSLNTPAAPGRSGAGNLPSKDAAPDVSRNSQGGVPLDRSEPQSAPPDSRPANQPAAPGSGGFR